MNPSPPLVVALAGLSWAMLSSGCAKHADFVNVRQEVRATIRAHTQAREKARERHEALNERLQKLEVAVESDEAGRRLSGLVLRLQRVEERLIQLEEAQRRQASEALEPPEPLASIPELFPPAPGREQRGPAPHEPPVALFDEPARAFLPGVPGATPTSAFNEAYKDYLNGRYDLAVTGFQRFLQDFPSASLAPNAHYWLGESYSHKRDYVRAIQSFERIINEYPGHEKVPSALFKIGLAATEIGATAKARNYLKRVIEDYSASNEARLAKHKLAEIR